MNTWESLYGPNVGYALELYERYTQDPSSVDGETRAQFDKLLASGHSPEAITALARPASATHFQSGNGRTTIPQVESQSAPPVENGSKMLGSTGRTYEDLTDDSVSVLIRAARMARSIREYGHLAARIDPLGATRPGDPMLELATYDLTEDDLKRLPASTVWPAARLEAPDCLQAIYRLREIYSGSLGYEFDHIQDYEERSWLHRVVESGTLGEPLTPDAQRALLFRLTEVEQFERFLHSVFSGQKRFSLEGNDLLVPMLDELVRDAAGVGTREVLLGMAHRGRLNVLAHVLNKPYTEIFSEFHRSPNRELVPSEGSSGINYGWTGDVKYHLGGHRVVREGDLVQVQLTLADNPSHLEFVAPVIEGLARAAQERRDEPGVPVQNVDRALPVTIHGDAAFPGEGVVSETLNLSRLPGYLTGGSVRIIVNNQIGFTTAASAGRSTLYASDLAKGFEIPIVHVNADDPEAGIAAIRLAHAYRHRFKKDFLIDLVGYRRWGHNEGDEPNFTQPRLYAQIADHPTVRTLYRDRLIRNGVISPEQDEQMVAMIRERLERAREELPSGHSSPEGLRPGKCVAFSDLETAVPADELRAMNAALLDRPEGFHTNPKLERILERRREAVDRPGGIEWALAESLALASILQDGTPIRMSGQDTERGTFSQRHLVLHDSETGRRYIPLQVLPQAHASFAVYNSPLTESAVLGFEYGYSVHAPETLVLWEAQFGDFANVGQVLIDQFIVAARAKWRQSPGLVLLLPHGYEGQGPEHSSGRVERYLQLAAEENLRITNCSTAAQYFHLLRAQALTLSTDRRPLIVMTPKSLLRHPLAGASLKELAEGHFEPVLDDNPAATRRESVQRLILCSGKVAVDLTTTAKTRGDGVSWVAVARVEQLYPFPADVLKRVLTHYPNLREVVWLQEEPRNMGAWSYISLHLREILPAGIPLRYFGRPERASTAEGYPDDHTAEQSRILDEAFSGERSVLIETQGVQDVS